MCDLYGMYRIKLKCASDGKLTLGKNVNNTNKSSMTSDWICSQGIFICVQSL